MSEIIGLKKTTVNGGIPVFQKVIETAQGGFTLDRNDNSTPGDTIPAGTPVTFDESTRLAKVDSSVINTNVKGLLYNDIIVPTSDEPEVEVSVVIRGTVYERRILDADGNVATIASNIKAALPNIIFSESF